MNPNLLLLILKALINDLLTHNSQQVIYVRSAIFAIFHQEKNKIDENFGTSRKLKKTPHD